MKKDMDLFKLKVDKFDSELRRMLLSQNEFSKLAGIAPQTFCRARRGLTLRMSTVRAILAAMGGKKTVDDFFVPIKTKVGNISI